MPRLLSSLRFRLTVWHTLVLATVTIAFAVGSYTLLASALFTRTEHFIDDALDAFTRELAAESQEMPTTELAIRAALSEVEFRDLQIMIVDMSGRLVAAGVTPRPSAAEARPGASAIDRRIHERNLQRDRPPLNPDRVLAELRRYDATARAAVTLSDSEGGYRVHVRPVKVNNTPFRLAGAYQLHDGRTLLQLVQNAYLIAISLLLAGAGIAGYFLAKRSLAPVSAMTVRAGEISETNLHERLPVATGEELGRLATVVNSLLDRLEAAFAQQRRFMADASHELRTPVAILRTETEVTLARDHRAENEYRESVAVMRDAANRLGRVVDDLFLLARADAGHLVPHRDEVYLDEVVHGATRALRSLADRRQVRVELAPVVDAPIRGDADLLGRLLLNLLDNAIKFSPPGGKVDVELARRNGSYEISVVDEGPGIPPEARDRVFERFFRADTARTHAATGTTSGAGLGLAIAKWIAEAHGGLIGVVDSRPGHSEFRVTLPVAGKHDGKEGDGEADA
jgi:heavy metal sensor kinase